MPGGSYARSCATASGTAWSATRKCTTTSTRRRRSLRGSPRKTWTSYFGAEFERTGFTGGINYYRNLDRNCELAAAWADAKVQVPTKYVVSDGEITYHFEGVKEYIHGGGFKEDVPLLEEVVVLPGAGHFIQQERAQEVSDHIYDFIAKF
ncbi:hypothetical protein ZWY2020_037206 [Hordeum vulgare]|nr:hypothetical protein ZWY2020_005625 [Hordeum vulgare]KAI5016828.1 hypothetical protein ZWY2020_037206 [Hordeum vulgare]